MTSDTPATDRRWYQFGPFVVDAPKRLIWRHRTPIPLTAKAFEILLVLIERRGHAVEKQELMEAVWPKTTVEENTLTRHISTLRKVLEERPEHHEYILTVPGHGYQFVADVIELDRRPEVLLPPPAAPVETGHASTFQAPDAATEAPLAVPAAPVRPERREPVATPRAGSGSAVMFAAGLVLVTVTAALVVAAFRVESPAPPAPQRALRQFTFHGGLQKDPAWSPDGWRVAYSSEHGGNSDIFVQTLGTVSPQKLTSWSAEDSQPDWSPDGESLVFRSERDAGGLFVMPVAGGTPRKVAAFGYRPQWSPRGEEILFSSSGHLGGTPKFHVVNVDGSPPRPLRPDLFDEFRPLHAGWRPDGQAISLTGRHARDGWTFLTVPVGAGPATRSRIDPAVQRRLDDAGVALDRFTWARSGRYLYFEGRAHGTQSVWRIGVDPATLAWTSGPDRLTTGTTEDSDADVSPDGTRLVFSARTSRTRLWMFPFDAANGRIGGPGEPVTSGGAGEQDADLPDDGTTLVYRTLRGGTQQVWERTLSDGSERLLIGGDEWTRTRPRWSSDGRQLAYLKRRIGSDGSPTSAAVAILSVDDRRERLLTTPGAPELVPTDWSPDGRDRKSVV